MTDTNSELLHISPDSSFWSAVVKSGTKLTLEIPDNCYISITNVCLPTPPPDQHSPVRLIAHVKTISEDSLRDANETFKTTHSDTLLSSLLPGAGAHQHINALFSPLNIVELEVTGGADVHIAGLLMPIGALSGEEEEEEEEEYNDEPIEK